MELISTILSIAILGLFGAWILVFVPYNMARKRGRNPTVWALISLLVLPLFTIAVLWLLGDAQPEQDDNSG